MKASLFIPGVGFALAGALALTGAAVPARAEGSTTANVGVVDGLVVSEADASATAPGTLKIHPAFGPDVTLSFDASTHFRKAGGELGTPDELTGALVPAVQKPTPAWFVHLFARAYYDKTSFLASQVSLSAPEPLLVDGVVAAGATSSLLVLNDPKRGTIQLTINGDTFLRKAGLPVTDASVFQAGDQAQALFWLTPTDNEALRVHGHAPPPQHFEGVLTNPLSADGTVVSFDVTRGTAKMSFTDDSNTAVKVDGKQGTVADLHDGQFVSVYYHAGANGNLAVGVLATTPKPKPVPPTPKPNTGGTGDGNGNTNTGGNGSTGGDGHKPPTPKPVVVKPQVVQGVVSAMCDGSVFQVAKADGTVLAFAVAANKQFRKSDKPAACSDVTVGTKVYVVFTPGATDAALAVVIVPAPSTGAHGSGDGAGAPTTGGTK